jgi:serine/threonine-protein kinase RsbT
LGIEIIAEDQGPGIVDVDKAMEVGFSTSNGLGAGLPGVRRLMDEFELNTSIGVGTRIRVFKRLR